jgi:hypothetical protein
LLALDQEAYVLYEYHQGMEIGRLAMKEHVARLEKGW